MSKSKVKTNNVSGFRIAVMIISILMLSFVMAFSVLLGISSLKQNGPIGDGDVSRTTVRKQAPTDGTLPTDSTALDNIGYMAYVMDNQPFYHTYAYNSTKSTGYEQVTQSWKDYKSAEISGEGFSIMVASDLSYSALIKSSTQSCFIGDDKALIRSGSKPSGVDTKPLDLEWATERPSSYDKNGYKYVYGEFSTEISVYVIDEKSLIGADPVVNNGDGTYSQKYYLNEEAGVWYQYGMKTRGGLKNFPEFKKVEIIFTFNEKWEVLESYCEETATISPKALGGMPMGSNSKTTTTYDYTEEGFDNRHYAYYNDFFKQYKDMEVGDNAPAREELGVLDVLGGGFGKVVSESGQQFKLNITLGETEYEGKIYLKLPDMGNVLETLDARVVLEKKGTGKQDFFVDFKNGKINVYYSTDFAMTVDIDEISKSVTKITDWINGINVAPAAAGYALDAEEQSSGLDLEALLDDLKLELRDSEAIITLKSDDLLGLGIGIDVVLDFDRIQEEDGDLFSIKGVDLNYINYKGTPVNVTATIVPDDGEIITRQESETSASLSDYIDSIYEILTSNTIAVDITLDDKLIEGLTLNAKAYLAIGTDIAARVEISALYKDISLQLDATYIYDGSSYGKIYLHVGEINGKAVDAKIYCDIGDAADAIEDIIALFGDEKVQVPSIAEQAEVELASIINKVLNLNFAKVIGRVYGDEDVISLDINVDELLNGLGVSLDINFGTLTLTVDRANTKISGSISELGLNVDITGSNNGIPALNKEDFVDVTLYIESVYSLLQKPAYDIAISFGGAKLSDSIDLSELQVNGVATVAIEGKTVRVQLPAVVEYGDYGLELTAYYTINLSDGDYGEIYLHITSLKLAGKTKNIDAKIYGDIKHVADGVQEIIAKFGTQQEAKAAAANEQSTVISKAVETLLNLDFNEIIHATNEKLTVKLDIDEILSGLDISLGGIQLGVLDLEFVPATGTLGGRLEKLNLGVVLSGNDTALAEFVTDGFVDLGVYLDSVNALLQKPSYDVAISFDGAKLSDSLDLSELKVNGVATVAIEGETVRVQLPATVEYEDYGVEFTAYYTVNISDGNYGEVYLHITSLTLAGEASALDAKVYCDIKQVVEGVKEIVAKFVERDDEEDGAADEEVDILSKAIETLLDLNFNKIISATNEKLTVNLDIDEILSGLEISLGVELGKLNLEFVPATGTLSGRLEKLNLGIILSGNDTALAEFETDGYVDLGAYLDSINGLLNDKTYDVKLTFVGNDQIKQGLDLTGLTLDLVAQLAFVGNYDGVKVDISRLFVEYENVSVVLSARYEVNFDGSYGTVYLDISKINDDDVSAKIKLNITDAVDGVTYIINTFKNSDDKKGGDDEGDGDTIGKIVDAVLSFDFNEILRVTDEKAEITLDIDALLAGLELGIKLGTVNLEYNPTSGVLSGSDSEIGLTYIEISGNENGLKSINPDDYIDLNEFIDGVQAIVDSEFYEIGITFTGSELTSEIDLSGLSLNATIFAKLENGYNNITVSADMEISYYGIDVVLSAYYTADIVNKNYTTVYLTLKSINGTSFNAKIYCNIECAIEAVNDIIDILNPTDSHATAYALSGNGNKGGDIISKVVGILLDLDYAEIIRGSKNNLSVTLDVDEILSALELDIDLGGISFGDAKLSLSLDEEKNLSLGVALEEFGAVLTVKGNNSYKMPAPPKESDFLDVTEAIRFAEAVINASLAIKDAEDIIFSLEAYTTIDGTPVSIEGHGEASWGNNPVKVEIYLLVTIGEDEDGEKLEINFVYDATATGDLPLVVMSVNDWWTTISVNEIDLLVDTFKSLIGAFTGNNSDNTPDKDTPATPEEDDEFVSPDANGYAIAVGGKTLDEILENDNVKKVLNAIIGFIGEFTIELHTDGINAVRTLAVRHAAGVTLSLGVDDGLWLNISANGNLSALAGVEAGNGAKFNPTDKLVSRLSANTKSEENPEGGMSYFELSDFVKTLYNAFFAKLDSILDTMGDEYAVSIDLAGSNSGIDALKEINIKVDLFYGAGVSGDEKTTNLVRADLNLNIKGTLVTANIIYSASTLFIELDEVGATSLAGTKFRTETDNLFEAVEKLVRLVTDTNLAETVGRFIGNGAPSANDTESIAAYAALLNAQQPEPLPGGDENEQPEATASLLERLLDAILTLDIDEAFKFNREEGTAKINVDSISEVLFGVKIGTVDGAFNKDNKSLKVDVSLDNKKPWLGIDAAPCTVKRDIVNPADYMDIGFISILVSDLENCALDENNNVYDLYTFTGSITVTVDIPVIGFDIVFNKATLTVGLENDKFYFSLAAHLNKKTVGVSSIFGSWLDFMSYTVTEERDISITYSDGLMVFGINVGSSSEVYKVFTLEYLIDNLENSSTSPLRWLLGTSEGLWSLIFNNVGLNLDSGLTKPQTYALYEEIEQLEQKVDFDLGEYITGMLVKANGEQFTYGKVSKDAASKLGISDNFYMFDVNVNDLTDGTLTTLYAAIIRNNGRISGLKAYGEIVSLLNFKLDLSTYLEGTKEVYDGTNNLGTVAVRNYLDYVKNNYGLDLNHNFGAGSNHRTPIFGCYTTGEKNSEGSYASSDVLDIIYLDIYGLDGISLLGTLEVRYGSTVLLIREGFPEFVDKAKTIKLIYVNEDGDDLKLSIEITDAVIKDGRVSIYQAKSPDSVVEVEFHFVDEISGEEIISPISAALGDGELYADYELNNYTFRGWFEDKNFKAPTSCVDLTDYSGKIVVYGRYIETVYKAENGINYTFDKTLTGYYVSGTNKNISDYYYGGIRSGEWLEIASEINGYPVYYIGERAFANRHADDEHSLVNVLVPESITAVYANAFSDNKKLSQVVFCADYVFFGGTADKNSTTSVFYGCHPGESASGNNGALTVYYNGTQANNYKHVSSESGVSTSWNLIYYEEGKITNAWREKKYTFNAQTATKESGWVFADFVIDASGFGFDKYGYLSDLSSIFYGKTESVNYIYTAQEIEAIVLAQINRLTAENESFIDGFDVVVSNGTRFGKYTVVNITLREAANPAYRVFYNADGNAYISGVSLYDGGYYATAGSDFEIIPNDGYELYSVIINGDTVELESTESYLFTMPFMVTEINIVSTKKPFTQVTLVSEIDFTMEGVEGYVTNATINAKEGSPMIGAATASDGNYIFIGWAYKATETSYAFEGDTVNYSVYYAVWAYRRSEIKSLSTEGLTLKATLNSGVDSVYGWYTDSAFTGDALVLCTDSSATFTTVTSTIVYARLVYTYSYSMTGGSVGTNKFYVNEDNSQDQTTSSSGSFKMLEGTQLTYSWADGEENKVLKVDFVNENGIAKTLYFRIVYAALGLNATTNPVKLGGSVSNTDATNGKSITVSSSLSMTIKKN